MEKKLDKTICKAINEKRILQFSYQGHRRLVEPHTYGIDHLGHKALSAYQVGGTSTSGVLGWKLFHTDKITSLSVLQDEFYSHRNKYVKCDTRMSTIFCEL